MRVIAGSLGGRQFDAPKGHRTHPMSDRMRGALFNVLGDITDLRILDAFAGSGALSIEAISRGAASSIAIDVDKTAHQIILSNLDNLNLNQKIKVIRANSSGWSDNNPEEKFDLVLCDPPFDELKIQVLQKLATHVTPGGLLVLSWPNDLDAPALQGLEFVPTKEKHYGNAQLVFYKKNR
jgi:16S rRNA (guanine966-N2)-methyltransferase